MAVAIVTDASVDLDESWAAEQGVGIAAVEYTIDGRRFSTADQPVAKLHDALRRGADVRVIGVEPDAFEAAIRSVAEGADAVVCVCQSFGSTFTYVSAEVAARRVEAGGTPVRIINTGRSGAAQAAIAMTAARVASGGADVDTVCAAVEAASRRADTYLVVPSLDQLERAGVRTTLETQSRAGRLDEGVPLLRVRGQLSAVAVAGDASEAERALVERAAGTLDGARAAIVVTHAGAAEDARRLAALLAARLGVQPVATTDLGPTLGALVGVGAYGAGFCAAKPLE